MTNVVSSEDEKPVHCAFFQRFDSIMTVLSLGVCVDFNSDAGSGTFLENGNFCSRGRINSFHVTVIL